MRALALLLLLQPTPHVPTAPAPRVAELSRVTTGALPERVLDLAFVDEKSLLVLSVDALALYRLDGSDLSLVEREPLPGTSPPVRAPGGLLVLADGGAFCWALTSGTPRATLFAVERGGLERHSEADAVPWPGVDAGVRFRAGTNLLQAALPAPEGPFLRLVETDRQWVVGVHGELWSGGRATSLRVGPALAALGSPWAAAAASPSPPAAVDDLLVLADVSARLEIVARLSVPGAVRALASREQGAKRILAAAIESPDGVFRIVLLELAEVAA